MSDTPQSLANHGRLHPAYHLVLAPILFLNIIGSIVWLVRAPGWQTAWGVVMSLALMGMLVLLRTYPMKVQDRVIRLEERLRLAALLPEPLRSRIPELTIDQLVGLRFASDAELPPLVERTLRENLNAGALRR
jgi:hypothetical protein